MSQMSKLLVLVDKDLREHFMGKRIYASIFLLFLIGAISIYSALTGFSNAGGDGREPLFFLRVFSSSGSGLPSFASLITFLLPLVSIVLGFDAINGEKVRGTLSRIMAQPVHRDSILLAKLVVGIKILSLMILVLFSVVTAVVILIIGIPPTFEEVMRLMVYMLLTIVFSGIWFSMAVWLSVLSDQTTVSALVGISIWLLVTFFLNLIYQGIVGVIYPIGNTLDPEMVINNQKLLQILLMASPINLYSDSISAILNPEVRSLGLIFYEQLQGAIPGRLPVYESIMVILPHILLMVGFGFAFFLLAYMKFIKQDIRPS